MQVMIEVTNPLAREQTMTKVQDKAKVVAIKELLERDEDFVRSAVQSFVQAALEAEMTEALAAGKGERTDERLGYRSGYYSRALITRVGTLELRVPQDRAGRFSTELFERYQRSEKALVGTLAEMYVQGVSTRKVKAVTEALCGHGFSASAISAINKSLEQLDRKPPGAILRHPQLQRPHPGDQRAAIIAAAVGQSRLGSFPLLGSDRFAHLR